MIGTSKTQYTCRGLIVIAGLAIAPLLHGSQDNLFDKPVPPLLAQAENPEDQDQQQPERTATSPRRPTQPRTGAQSRPRQSAPAEGSRSQSSRPAAQQRRPGSPSRQAAPPGRRPPPSRTTTRRPAPPRRPPGPPPEPIAKYSEAELKAMASDIGRLSGQLESLNRRTMDRLEEASPDETVPLGERFRFEGDLRRMQQLERQLNDYPDDFETLISAGILLKRNHKYRRAEDYLVKALALEPLNQGLLSNLADLYLEKGEHTKAWKTLQEIIYLNPDNVDAFATQGRIRLQEQNFSGADAIYRQMEGKFGDVAQVYAHRALIFIHQERYGEAIALAREGISLHPDYARLFYVRGQAYEGLGLIDRAWTDYYDALALDPDMLDTYEAIGDLALREKNAVTSMKAYRRIVDMRPGDPRASLGLATAYLIDSRFHEAVAELEMLQYLQPEYREADDRMAQAYYLRSLQLHEQGLPRQALDMHCLAFSLAGSRSTQLVVAALLMAGDGAFSNDDYHQAVKFYELALDNDPFSIEGYLGLGYAFRALGEDARARATFQQALIIDPVHPDARAEYERPHQP